MHFLKIIFSADFCIFYSLNHFCVCCWTLVENAHCEGTWGRHMSGIHRCPAPHKSNSAGGNPRRWTGHRVSRSPVGSLCHLSRHTTMCLDPTRVPSRTECTGLRLGRNSSYKSGGTLHIIRWVRLHHLNVISSHLQKRVWSSPCFRGKWSSFQINTVFYSH